MGELLLYWSKPDNWFLPYWAVLETVNLAFAVEALRSREGIPGKMWKSTFADGLLASLLQG